MPSVQTPQLHDKVPHQQALEALIHEVCQAHGAVVQGIEIAPDVFNPIFWLFRLRISFNGHKGALFMRCPHRLAGNIDIVRVELRILLTRNLPAFILKHING